MPIISKTIPNLVGIQMYYIPPEVVDPLATPIYQNWDSNIIIDQVGNRTQYDASTNPDNVLLYSWNMEYLEPVKNYFWIKNLSNETANVTMTNYTTAEYRVKGTESWRSFSGTTNNVAPGQTIEVRRAGTLMHPGIIKCDKEFSVGGDVMSLLYGENFELKSMPTVSAGSPLLFRNLLQNNTTLIDASTLILPSSGLLEKCFQDMFLGDSSLLYPPKLEATVMAKNCYEAMFEFCYSMTYAPVLPATTLAENCYLDMFQQCTSLTQAPELPATTLANGCYKQMFYYCTSLTQAPVLPATTMADSCYYAMFESCEFVSPPELPATTLADSCYRAMFLGCVNLTSAPELPATTLADSCYREMFYYCTSLTQAPELPALTLVTNCYRSMFRNCSYLNYIKAMFLTAPTLNYTYLWVFGVADSGTFIKNASATWLGWGSDGVPSGWTVLTASS